MQRPRRLWAGQDSNLRSAFARRIYSPVPLTTRPPTHEVDRLQYEAPATGSYRVAEGFEISASNMRLGPTWHSGDCITFVK